MCNYVKHPEVEVVDVMCCKTGPHPLPSMKQDIIPTVMTMLVGHRNHKNRNSAHRRMAQLRTIYLQRCGQHPADTEVVYRRHVDKHNTKTTACALGIQSRLSQHTCAVAAVRNSRTEAVMV